VIRASGWRTAPAAAAPAILVVGWIAAARAQPGGFDSVSGTISALADLGARDRWIMTSALVAAGLCYLVSAAALCPPRSGARWLLRIAGAALLAVAAVPLHTNGGLHALLGAVAFGSLAGWPIAARRCGLLSAGSTAPVWCSAAFFLLLACVVAGQPAAIIGLIERLLAAGAALWPCAVAVTGATQADSRL
jgi:hypothetical membrane protein